MKAREYALMERCVDDAASHVWRRAFKHHSSPPVFTVERGKALEEAIVAEVMNSISEWFDFDNVAIE